MTRREQIKKEIDEISDDYLETLHRIIVALKSDSGTTSQPEFKFKGNPLKNSILFESDLISPVDETWNADQ
ncbi:MAG TPA: hypothetical protein PLM07_18690 [Candidatus Rifleibacterium sp.]|nr:hypothetical protein [Candidatus Rifleibacterium sp.]HPT47912.1 hypothetical protein [Candidatus Rifleibacterium sp.]